MKDAEELQGLMIITISTDYIDCLVCLIPFDTFRYNISCDESRHHPPNPSPLFDHHDHHRRQYRHGHGSTSPTVALVVLCVLFDMRKDPGTTS